MMELDEIVVKESPGLCRCCLSEGCYKDLGTEYSWMNDTEIYADMLLECFDISISQHNEGPNGPNRLICEVCITRLRDACNFKKQVVESEKKFVDMIGRGEFRPKVVIYQQAPMKTEKVVQETMGDDIEVEYLDEDIDFEDDLPLSETITHEPSVSDDVTVSSLKLKTKRGRPKKTSTVKTEKKAKTAKLEDKPRTSKAVTKGDESQTTRPSSEAKRRNLETLFKNTTIIPFKWLSKYRCFYCSDDIVEYDKFRTHIKSHEPCDYHPAFRKKYKIIKIDVSDITCKLCDESFNNVDSIIFHLTRKHNIEYHEDIKMPLAPYRLVDLKCLSCDESFNFFQQLSNHIKNNHIGRPSLHLKDMATVHQESTTVFKCIKCGNGFKNLSLLRRHGFEAHRTDILNPYKHRRTVRCTTCNKQFEGIHKLNAHKIEEHGKKYCCQECDEPFTNYITMLRHQLDAHNIGHPCTKCNRMFTRKSVMLMHFRRSHLKEKNVCCTLCLKEFFTTAQVKEHMLTHTKERKYTCDNCGKSYIRKRNLIIHITADHTF